MKYQSLTDNELWQLCLEDDASAFEELFGRYAVRLHQAAARHIRNQHAAEELAMDLVFNIWQKRHQITITGNFSSYLFRSLRNLIVDEYRKKVPVIASIDTLKHAPAANSHTADYPILSDEAHAFYEKKLSDLSPQRRRIFTMSRERDMSYAEIAKELDISVSTVESHLVSTLRILRQNVGEYTVHCVIFLAIFL